MDTFGKRLRQLREERGLHQSHVAELVGVTFQSYSSWELDKYQPDFRALGILVEFFNTTLDYLILGKE